LKYLESRVSLGQVYYGVIPVSELEVVYNIQRYSKSICPLEQKAKNKSKKSKKKLQERKKKHQ